MQPVENKIVGNKIIRSLKIDLRPLISLTPTTRADAQVSKHTHTITQNLIDVCKVVD